MPEHRSNAFVNFLLESEGRSIVQGDYIEHADKKRDVRLIGGGRGIGRADSRADYSGRVAFANFPVFTKRSIAHPQTRCRSRGCERAPVPPVNSPRSLDCARSREPTGSCWPRVVMHRRHCTPWRKANTLVLPRRCRVFDDSVSLHTSASAIRNVFESD